MARLVCRCLMKSDSAYRLDLSRLGILPGIHGKDEEDSRFLYIVRELHARPYIKTKPNRWYLELMNRVFLEAYEEKYGWTALVLNMVSQMVIEIVRWTTAPALTPAWLRAPPS